MFQTFDTPTNPANGPVRLKALRRAMADAGVDAFLVPRGDAHQGEYVAPHDARLAWLTGFTGSAGAAVILGDRAALFVDGRYTIQAGEQTDRAAFELKNIPADTTAAYLGAHLSPGQQVGYDPWLHTEDELTRLEKTLAPKGITLVAIDNLVDDIWRDQPAAPMGKVSIQPDDLAGRSHGDKRAEIAAALKEAGARAVVLTLPDSISWLLNIRGSDIERNPVVHAFAVLRDDASLDLFVAPEKLSEEVIAHLGPEVRLAAPDALGAALDRLSGPVGLDRGSAPVWIRDRLADAGLEIMPMRDPCLLPKARKSDAELKGMRAAHLRDAAAMCGFLAWLEEEGPKGQLTEIDVVRELESRRRATNALKDISFDTISGAGAHGAIVHYRVSEDTNRAVRPGELLLVDSGGQYADGTTDITRTVAIGPAPVEALAPFTLVLKGMIGISRLKWPAGLAGRDLDAIARAHLWAAGLDYDHGTGHGVGAYLSVHEGPQTLSRRGDVAFEPGMILSNEPGYYRPGAFGIRIENLVAVNAARIPEGGEREMLSFETLTHVPIDKTLIDPTLLGQADTDWLNAYHAGVRKAVLPLVDGKTADWLIRATAPL